jgi:hypothetical protein
MNVRFVRPFWKGEKGGRGVKDRHPALKNLSGRGKSVDAKVGGHLPCRFGFHVVVSVNFWFHQKTRRVVFPVVRAWWHSCSSCGCSAVYSSR